MNRNGFGILAFFIFLCFLGICIMTSLFYYQKVSKVGYYQPYVTVSRGGIGKMGNDYSDVNKKF